MQEPVKPKKPYKPAKPREFLSPQSYRENVNDGDSIQSILNMMGDIDPANVFISHEKGYDYGDYSDSCDLYIEWNDPEPRANPHYKKQLDKYEKNMKKYKIDKQKYDEDIIRYENKYKEYLIWFHSSALKKLG